MTRVLAHRGGGRQHRSRRLLVDEPERFPRTLPRSQCRGGDRLRIPLLSLQQEARCRRRCWHIVARVVARVEPFELVGDPPSRAVRLVKGLPAWALSACSVPLSTIDGSTAAKGAVPPKVAAVGGTTPVASRVAALSGFPSISPSGCCRVAGRTRGRRSAPVVSLPVTGSRAIPLAADGPAAAVAYRRPGAAVSEGAGTGGAASGGDLKGPFGRIRPIRARLAGNSPDTAR